MQIYVGNLNYRTTDADLRQAFAQFGQVAEAQVVMDRATNQSRGFGFVQMPDNAEAQAAIQGLNGSSLQGRDLRVNEARPMEKRPPRSGGFERRRE